MPIPSSLQVTEILDAALVAFSKKILPLRLLSMAVRKDQSPLNKGDKMVVPYYPLEGLASRDFVPATGYDFANGGPNVDHREVTVNKRKYQPLVTTSIELGRNNFDPAQLGKIKGARLAQDVVADVLSVITAANYGAASFTGAASTFDSDDVADIETACDLLNMPKENRSLILSAAYHNALQKDNSIKQLHSYGSTDPLREGIIPRVAGFDVLASNEIPANEQNLVGFACYSSAILVGFSPVTPAPLVMDRLTAYEVVTDPETGIMIEYRAWGDADRDQAKEVIEVNYGYAVGEAAALLLLVSA